VSVARRHLAIMITRGHALIFRRRGGPTAI
jgi:hypothetical protein